ncbi:hypothetical protein ACGGAI_28330 [Streptomyces antibioticus]|uniref:hypothetical protein n=1 Tax=Streptomyces antibioticus TaxID=1890 RepID=UPI0037159604
MGATRTATATAAGSATEEAAEGVLWVFLAIQILFLIWVITGAASGSGTPEGCQGLTGDELDTCNAASDVGTTIGVGLVIGLWAAVDVILGFSYVVYRLASRRT